MNYPLGPEEARFEMADILPEEDLVDNLHSIQDAVAYTQQHAVGGHSSYHRHRLLDGEDAEDVHKAVAVEKMAGYSVVVVDCPQVEEILATMQKAP